MIEKLEYLIALARERHFGRAATECGVTQPTLSAGIKQLEETLGALLVQRGSRYHGLTDEGLRTLDWARRIVADARAMRDDLRGAPTGLSGHLRLAAVPSALPAIAALTTPFHARHKDVTFSVLSRTSAEILALLEDLQIDAGLTYLDGDPLGRVRVVPLYQEQYCLVIEESEASQLGPSVTWAEVGQVPLCLLTPDMQNRRIIDARLRRAGRAMGVTLESNSMIVLMTHVRTGAWASVLSDRMAGAFGLPPGIRVIPIAEEERRHTIGLVYPHRDPVTPLTAELIALARGAASLEPG